VKQDNYMDCLLDERVYDNLFIIFKDQIKILILDKVIGLNRWFL